MYDVHGVGVCKQERVLRKTDHVHIVYAHLAQTAEEAKRSSMQD